MLTKVSLFIGILVGLVTLTTVTITTFLKANESFRKHLEQILKDNDKKNREWTKALFLDYYYPLDERLKNINYRLKNIEKQCEKNNH